MRAFAELVALSKVVLGRGRCTARIVVPSFLHQCILSFTRPIDRSVRAKDIRDIATDLHHNKKATLKEEVLTLSARYT
jgi:hypothetical protein